MNTKNNWHVVAEVTDPERLAIWKAAGFSDGKLPITSSSPILAHLPEHPNAYVYMLDLSAISQEQRDGTIKQMSNRFGIPADEIKELIDQHGVPVLSDHVTVTSPVKVSSNSQNDELEKRVKQAIEYFIAKHGWDELEKAVSAELGFSHTKTIRVYTSGESTIKITEYFSENALFEEDEEST